MEGITGRRGGRQGDSGPWKNSRKSKEEEWGKGIRKPRTHIRKCLFPRRKKMADRKLGRRWNWVMTFCKKHAPKRE